MAAQQWAVKTAAGAQAPAPVLAVAAGDEVASLHPFRAARKAVCLGAVMNSAQEPGSGFRALLREDPVAGYAYPLMGVGAAAGLAVLRPKRRKQVAALPQPAVVAAVMPQPDAPSSDAAVMPRTEE